MVADSANQVWRVTHGVQVITRKPATDIQVPDVLGGVAHNGIGVIEGREPRAVFNGLRTDME